MDPLLPFAGRSGARRRLELPDADIWIEDLFDATVAAKFLRALLTELPFRQDEAILFGKRHPMPRLTCWLGEPGATYAYSGIRNEPAPFTPTVAALRRQVEAAVGARFDSVLANLYRTGEDRLGWHSDDEAELGPDPLIASLSLGAARTFRLKHRKPTLLAPISIELQSGSLLVMAGSTQRCWLHAVPPRRHVREPRINLTFRRILCR